ncbi:hypothetical protein vseg_005517 [Gypsophila vaccaria]
MKRLREESYVGSQFKRSFGNSRAQLYGQPQDTVAMGGGGRQKLTTDDALQYLKEVKEMFRDQKEKYDYFLGVMKDFKAQNIDTDGVIARIKELFKGHNNLIYGFNTFLPKGFEIEVDEDEEPPSKKVVQFEEAITFVNKIKKRFEHDDQVYRSFLDILNMYRMEHKTISEVYDEVSQLFEDHSDLLEEFTRFLPNNSSPATVHHFTLNGRSNLQSYDERAGALSTSQPMHVDKRWCSGDTVDASHEKNGLCGKRPDLDGDTEKLRSHKEHRKHDKEFRDRRISDSDDRETEHDVNREIGIQQRVAEKKMPARKVESSDDKNALKSMYKQEFIFCEKVKEKLGTVDYQAFLKCLHIYSTEIITRNELLGLVADLLAKHPDLMDGFSEFLDRCENLHGFLAGVMKKKCLLSDGPLPRQAKADDRDKGPKREVDPAKEKPNKDYSSKSIQELDLSNCQRCTPSYRLLPPDYPIPTVSHRSELGAQLLNDYWVSVTSGSEDYSFKHMRRNQYEESLFKCEDDRYELDMLLETVRSTINKAEDLLNSINDGSVSGDAPIRIEEYFPSLNLRCIERLYGDHGLDVIDILHKNPALALPVILTRLKQKQEEWTKCRGDFNKVWDEVYAKNHFKSLDHRSFYFKQQDSKNLSTKSLVAEITEIKESLQKGDDMLVAVCAGNKRPLVSHFKFEYSDGDIHEDIYKLMKFSCEEVLPTKEQLNKVMRLWTTFLEPMLGVTPHVHGLESAQRPGKEGMVAETVGHLIVGAASINARQPKLVVGGVESGRRKKRSPSNCDTTVEESPLVEVDAKGKEESSSNTQTKALNNGAEDTEDPKSTTDAIQPQSAAAEALAGMENGVLTQCSKSIRHLEKNFGQLEIDKEEGELLPNGDDDLENSGNGDKQAVPTAQHLIEGLQYQDGIVEECGLENEDSENASEGGNNVSGSESAGDECSREEHDEEVGAEHNEIGGKAETEAEAEVHSLKSREHFLSAKPLAKYLSLVSRDSHKKDFQVFYGNDEFYALFKLHQALYERILTAKTHSTCSESKWRNSKDPNPLDPYASFMTALYSLLDGSSDNTKFEDVCRTIIGNQSYVLFTLDKLIYKLVKQLQAIVTDEMDGKLLQLYEYERSRKPGEFVDSIYHDNARVLLQEDNIYRLEFASLPYRMSIQLMDSGNERPEMVGVSIDPNFAAYLSNDLVSIVSSRKEPRGIMMQRNKKLYTGLDEYSATSKAMEGVNLSNGLECKVACSSSKISYVLDTEDLFFRTKRARKSQPADLSERQNQARVHRFNKFLSAAFRK